MWTSSPERLRSQSEMPRLPVRGGAINLQEAAITILRGCDYHSEMVRSLSERLRLPLRDGAITLREAAITTPRWCDYPSEMMRLPLRAGSITTPRSFAHSPTRCHPH